MNDENHTNSTSDTSDSDTEVDCISDFSFSDTDSVTEPECDCPACTGTVCGYWCPLEDRSDEISPAQQYDTSSDEDNSERALAAWSRLLRLVILRISGM